MTDLFPDTLTEERKRASLEHLWHEARDKEATAYRARDLKAVRYWKAEGDRLWHMLQGRPGDLLID